MKVERKTIMIEQLLNVISRVNMMKNTFSSFLFFVIFSVIFLKCVNFTKINYSASGLIFYNLNNNNTLLPPIITSEKYSKLKLPRIGLPCSCQNSICGCCVGMNAQQNNMHFCTNFTYNPQDFSIQMNVLMNDNSIYQNSLSARNPPPVCIPVPIPYIPIQVDMCIKLFDVFTPGNNLHMCMDLLARIQRAPVIVLHFDCLRMGQDGFAFLKPDAEGGIGEIEQNGISSTSDNPEPPQLEYETYDEVTEN